MRARWREVLGTGAALPRKEKVRPCLLLWLVLAEGLAWWIRTAVMEESATRLEEGIHSQSQELSAKDYVTASLGSGLPRTLTP